MGNRASGRSAEQGDPTNDEANPRAEHVKPCERSASMRIRVLLLSSALAIAATGCALQSVIRGDGHVVSESRSVSGFHAVSLSHTGLLRLRQTGTESLTLEAESNILPNIETRSDD